MYVEPITAILAAQSDHCTCAQERHIRSEGNKRTNCPRIPCYLRRRRGKGGRKNFQPIQPWTYSFSIMILPLHVWCVPLHAWQFEGNLPMVLQDEADSDQYFATHSSGLYFKINDHPSSSRPKAPFYSRNSSRVGSHFHVSKLEFSICIQSSISQNIILRVDSTKPCIASPIRKLKACTKTRCFSCRVVVMQARGRRAGEASSCHLICARQILENSNVRRQI